MTVAAACPNVKRALCTPITEMTAVLIRRMDSNSHTGNAPLPYVHVRSCSHVDMIKKIVEGVDECLQRRLKSRLLVDPLRRKRTRKKTQTRHNGDALEHNSSKGRTLLRYTILPARSSCRQHGRKERHQ